MSFSVRHDGIDEAVHLQGHSHASWHLVAVTVGEFEELVGDTICRASAGVLRLSKPDTAHDIIVPAGGTACVIFDLPSSWMTAFGKQMEGKRGDIFIRDQDLFDRICSAASLARTDGGEAKAGLLCREALANLYELSYRGEHLITPQWLLETTYVLNDGKNPERIAAIARAAGMSREHFARAFRRHMGCRASEYRSVVRALRAADLLRTTDTPLAALAVDLGYVDQSHMTRELKRHVGLTPAAVRAASMTATRTDRPDGETTVASPSGQIGQRHCQPKLIAREGSGP